MLATAPAAAFAADWKVAGLILAQGNRAVTYVDAASVKEKRGRIRFRSEQYLERGTEGYTRVSALSEVDCASMKVTVLREAYYAGPALVAFGKPREANYYSSSSGYHWLVRRVCSGVYLSDSVRDHGRDSTRLFALDWTPVPGRLSVARPVELPGGTGATIVAVAASAAASAGAPR